MSDDVRLSRMLYFFNKEMAESYDYRDIIIVTSFITKDMTSEFKYYYIILCYTPTPLLI